jgi:hypothetical protein
MTEAEMVARLLVAKGGRNVDENIGKVIEYLCEEYRDRCGAEGEPSLMELAVALLDEVVERGVALK